MSLDVSLEYTGTTSNLKFHISTNGIQQAGYALHWTRSRDVRAGGGGEEGEGERGREREKEADMPSIFSIYIFHFHVFFCRISVTFL